MAVLTDQELSGLSTYKYKFVDYSILGKYVMQPYWTYMLRFIPVRMAPNMVTFIGFAVVLFTFGVLASYLYGITSLFSGSFSPSANFYDVSENIALTPNWVWILCGAGIFFYSTMDALDGKQARRIQAGSPLGELVDHGCDALSLILVAFMTSCAFGFPNHLFIMGISSLSFIGLITTMWEQRFTGHMTLGYVNAPTEGVLSSAAIMIITGIFGVSFWTDATVYPSLLSTTVVIPFSDFKISIATWQSFMEVSSIFLGVFQLLYSFWNVISKMLCKEGTRAARVRFMTTVLFHIVPYLILYTLHWHFYLLFFNCALNRSFFLCSLAFGLVAANAGTRFTISRLSSAEISVLFPSFLALYALYTILISLVLIAPSLMPTVALTVPSLLFAVSFIALAEYITLLWTIFNDFAHYLKINIFTLTEAQKKKLKKLKLE